MEENIITCHVILVIVSSLNITGRLRPSEWDSDYNVFHGSEKINIRISVYEVCADPQLKKLLDFQGIVIDSFDKIYRNPKQKHITIVDIGCSYPTFLMRWKKAGHKGHLVGIEPNTKQFNDLPFWREGTLTTNYVPSDRKELSASSMALDASKHRSLPSNIDLYESDANALASIVKSVDLITYMFSFYHIPRSKQLGAVNAARQVLRKRHSAQDSGKISSSNADVEGILALATSGKHNKKRARKDEIRIANLLSHHLGTKVFAPEPLNHGFTSEDADKLLPAKFKYVYVLRVQGKLLIDNAAKKDAYLDAHRTIVDNYRCTNPKLEKKKKEMFEKALMEVVGEKIDRLLSNNKAHKDDNYFKDELHRALYFCSDRPLENIEAMGFVRVNPAS